MAKPEWGSKRICVSCGARFYDLRRAPAVCPQCGTEQPAEQPRLKRGGLPPPADDKLKRRPGPAAVVPDALPEEVEIEDVEADEEEEVIEDTSELEGEEGELGSVIDVEEGAPDTER